MSDKFWKSTCLGSDDLYKVQDDLEALSGPSSQRFFAMDPLPFDLSSSAHTSKLVTRLATRRPSSLSSFPSINCGYNTEELSSTKKRRLSYSPPSWSYFEVYGDAVLSTSGSAVTKRPSIHEVHRAGSSRVLAAWKKIQLWSPLNLKTHAEHGERRSTSKSFPILNWHGYGGSKSKPQSKAPGRPETRKYSRLPDGEAHVRESWKIPASRKSFLQASSKETKSKRQVAVTAITRALTPCLSPHREGQGELALRMAKFLSSFKSSAQTNETRSCEERVRRNLDLMLKRTEAAEGALGVMLSRLDASEEQLHAVPSRSDIEHLEALLNNLQCHQRNEDHACASSTDLQHAQRLIGGSRNRQLDQILLTTANFEDNLTNAPTVEGIHQLRQEVEDIDRELTRYDKASREAVNLLHFAVARGEVSWFRNLETSAACLEAMARTVLPLEGLYTTP